MKDRSTIHGVTRPIVIKLKELGFGKYPRGRYSRDFEGSVSLVLKGDNIKTSLGPAAREVSYFYPLREYGKNRGIVKLSTCFFEVVSCMKSAR